MKGRLVAALVAALGASIAAAGAGGHPVPGASRCPVFPADNPWNRRVDKLPVLANSAAIVASIGRDTGLHADFGSGLYQGRPIGIPYEVVNRHTPRVPFRFQYAGEQPRRASVYPARTSASTSPDPDLPAMGQRLRLKASFDPSGFPPQSRVVLEALKRYGMIVADNGSNWYISGAPNSRWSNDDL